MFFKSHVIFWFISQVKEEIKTMTPIYPILSITIFLNVEFYDDTQMRNVTLCYKLPQDLMAVLGGI